MKGLWKELYKERNENEYIKYLRKLLNHHSKQTEYWKERNIDKINSLEDIINFLIVDEEDLRSRWNKFYPSREEKIRAYQSSGTTGKRKFVYWSENYLDFLVYYLTKYLRELYNDFKINKALVHGPYGWYQEEMSKLVWSFGGYLYFIGIETEGLKKLLMENPAEIQKLLSPLINNTIRILQIENNIDTVRTAPETLEMLKDYLSSIRNIFISGTSITPQKYRELSELFPGCTIIPLYGDFLFGDAIGIFEDESDKLIYYPPYPAVMILPVRKVENKWEIVNYGERGKKATIISRPDLLLVLIDEKEEITRERPKKPFKWDGFSNPERII